MYDGRKKRRIEQDAQTRLLSIFDWRLNQSDIVTHTVIQGGDIASRVIEEGTKQLKQKSETINRVFVEFVKETKAAIETKDGKVTENEQVFPGGFTAFDLMYTHTYKFLQ